MDTVTLEEFENGAEFRVPRPSPKIVASALQPQDAPPYVSCTTSLL